MTRVRPAEEKFLALLARMPAPLDTNEIASALNWSRQNVQAVGVRCERDKRVERHAGARLNGAAGRPADLWGLPGKFRPDAPEQRVQFERDTVVVTPANEEARVIGMRGRSMVELEYITGPERFQRVTLQVSLVRAFQPGRERPEPVRVASSEGGA